MPTTLPLYLIGDRRNEGSRLRRGRQHREGHEVGVTQHMTLDLSGGLVVHGTALRRQKRSPYTLGAAPVTDDDLGSFETPKQALVVAAAVVVVVTDLRLPSVHVTTTHSHLTPSVTTHWASIKARQEPG